MFTKFSLSWKNCQKRDEISKVTKATKLIENNAIFFNNIFALFLLAVLLVYDYIFRNPL